MTKSAFLVSNYNGSIFDFETNLSMPSGSAEAWQPLASEVARLTTQLRSVSLCWSCRHKLLYESTEMN